MISLRYIIINVAMLALCIILGAYSTPMPPASLLPFDTVLPHGRLALLLHEAPELENESPNSSLPGTLTMHAAEHIHNQASIIIMSRSLWFNLLKRRTLCYQESFIQGSIQFAIKDAYALLTKKQSKLSSQALISLLKQNRLARDSFILTLLKLSSAKWLIYEHPRSGLIVLIPKSYLEKREALLSRSQSRTPHATSLATGLNLDALIPITVPPLNDREASAAYLDSVERTMKEKTFNPSHLKELFITTRKEQPPAITEWDVYLTGHGTLQTLQASRSEKHNYIAGLPLHDFRKILTFFNTHVHTSFMYYQSCYAGGANSYFVQKIARPRLSILPPSLHLTYPIAIGSLGELPTINNAPYLFVTKNNIFIDGHFDFERFFTLLNDRSEPLESILRHITPGIMEDEDIHGITGTPFYLAPGTLTFQPINIYKKTTPKEPGTATLTMVKEMAYSTEHRPFVVTNSRSLLLVPQQVKTPLILHAYTAPHTQASIKVRPPALLFLTPGDAICHIDTMTLIDIGLRNFLVYSLFHPHQQATRKTFIIEKLTLENDLEKNFTKEHPLYKNLLQGTLTFFNRWRSQQTKEKKHIPIITLEKVVFIVTGNIVTASFYHRGTQEAYRVEHLLTKKTVPADASTLEQINAMAERTKARIEMFKNPPTMTIKIISKAQHMRIYDANIAAHARQVAQEPGFDGQTIRFKNTAHLTR